MAFAAFDTHEFVKTLEKAGLPEAQAEAISMAVRKSHEAADLATKADLREYESAIRGDLEKLEIKLESRSAATEERLDAKLEKLASRLRHEMSEMKFDLVRWIITAAIAQLGLLIGFLKFFPISS